MNQPAYPINKPIFSQWLTLGIALIILGGAVAFNLYFEHGRTEIRENERLATQARVIAENMERQLASINLALEGVRGDLPHWQGQAEHGLQALTLRLKALVNAMPGVRTMGVIDDGGTMFAASREDLIGLNFRHRDYFQIVRQQPNLNTLYISPPFKTVLGAFGINVTRMIAGPRGEFAGIIFATLDPEYFKTLMASVLYAPDMWDAIGHGDGTLFLMVPEREELTGKNLAQPGSFFSRHRDSGQTSTVLTGTVYSTRELRMMAQRTVHPESLNMDTALVVAVSRDLATIFQPWRRDVLMQTGLFGVIAVISVLGLHLYQRRQRIFDQQSAAAAIELRQTLQRLQLATEASGIGVWDYDTVSGQVVWDDAMYGIYGIDKAAVSSLYDAWHGSLLAEDRALEAAALNATLAQGLPYMPCFRIRRGDSELRYIQARARVYYDDAGKPQRMVGTNEDITERRQREAVRRELEARFRSTFDAAAIGMALVSLEGRFIQVNPSLCRILGYTKDELQQKSFQDITHPDDLQTDLALAAELLTGSRDSYQMEKRYFHKDGRVIWILLSGSAVRDDAGKALYFIAQIQDITERRTLLDQLERQAHQDYLTGLCNRRYFLELGELELSRTQRYGNALCLLMLDIDHFKSINDSHGHKAGDKVLQTFGKVCQETLRDVDIVGRLGGEEFAILLPQTGLEKAVEAAERLRDIIGGTDVMLAAGLPLRFTVSIGVTLLKGNDVNIDMLLDQADKALYEAKQTGRNKVCIFGDCPKSMADTGV
jgi:diguanylate cyclase (GGDEF)-like protein/PAS domain S-box-containing protein